MGAASVTDLFDGHRQSVIAGDIMIGDRIEIAGWPERVEAVSVLRHDPTTVIVRTDASVLVRAYGAAVEVTR